MSRWLVIALLPACAGSSGTGTDTDPAADTDTDTDVPEPLHAGPVTTLLADSGAPSRTLLWKTFHWADATNDLQMLMRGELDMEFEWEPFVEEYPWVLGTADEWLALLLRSLEPLRQ